MSVPHAKILATTIWNYIDPDRHVMTKVSTDAQDYFALFHPMDYKNAKFQKQDLCNKVSDGH